MKKVILGLAFIAFTTVSCKKDRICSCTFANDTVDVEIKNSKKSDAEAECNEIQEEYRAQNPEINCQLI